MLSVKDVINVLKCGRETGYVLMNSNQFPTIKLGRRLFVHKDVFDKWIKGELNYKKTK